MKTAMQQLIELLELNTTNEPLPYLIDVIKEVYIQKEKDQMFYWFYAGGGMTAKDEFEVEFEKYYDIEYNQTK